MTDEEEEQWRQERARLLADEQERLRRMRGIPSIFRERDELRERVDRLKRALVRIATSHVDGAQLQAWAKEALSEVPP